MSLITVRIAQVRDGLRHIYDLSARKCKLMGRFMLSSLVAELCVKINEMSCVILKGLAKVSLPNYVDSVPVSHVQVS